MWFPPAAMAAMGDVGRVDNVTGFGTDTSSQCPMPSWPEPLLPSAKTAVMVADGPTTDVSGESTGLSAGVRWVSAPQPPP